VLLGRPRQGSHFSLPAPRDKTRGDGSEKQDDRQSGRGERCPKRKISHIIPWLVAHGGESENKNRQRNKVRSCHKFKKSRILVVVREPQTQGSNHVAHPCLGKTTSHSSWTGGEELAVSWKQGKGKEGPDPVQCCRGSRRGGRTEPRLCSAMHRDRAAGEGNGEEIKKKPCGQTVRKNPARRLLRGS